MTQTAASLDAPAIYSDKQVQARVLEIANLASFGEHYTATTREPG
jgi:hypothetical protein